MPLQRPVQHVLVSQHPPVVNHHALLSATIAVSLVSVPMPINASPADVTSDSIQPIAPALHASLQPLAMVKEPPAPLSATPIASPAQAPPQIVASLAARASDIIRCQRPVSHVRVVRVVLEVLQHALPSSATRIASPAVEPPRIAASHVEPTLDSIVVINVSHVPPMRLVLMVIPQPHAMLAIPHARPASELLRPAARAVTLHL